MFKWFKKAPSVHLESPRAVAKDIATSGPAAQTTRLKESAVHKSLGDKYFDEDNFEKAAECYRQAIAINPNFAEAFDNLGIVLWQQKLYEEAEHCLKQAILIKPGMANTHYNLGSMLHKQGRLNEALRSFDEALEIKQHFAEAHNYKGIVLKELGRLDEASSSFRIARVQMLHQRQQLCEWGDLEADIQSARRAVLEAPPNDKNIPRPLAFFSLPGVTAEEQKRCAERWVKGEFEALVPLRDKLGFDFKRTANKTISVGYISADFRQHPVSFLMAEIFELHDRNRFHITAYSYGPDDGSAMRKRLEKAFDSFVDIRDNTYESAARKIYADHIDILVDLTGHTQDSRSGILALRPAPIQVNYLGYPGTMGADFVDYIIADRFTILPEMQQHYTEKVIWMPDCFMPNDRTRSRLAAPNRMDCGLPEHAFVFCCFNQTFKITPGFFDIWCRLLMAVPGSILWLPASNPHVEANLRREAIKYGVESGRIIMAARLPEIEAHLARLQCADLFLDTLPFNAHTTCSDALWMGLPVVTCAGETFMSRVAGSLLTAIGVPELITYNLDDYYRLALDLATDGEKLDSIRSKIIVNRETSPLFDSERFTRNLEKAYIQMMAEYAGNLDVH